MATALAILLLLLLLLPPISSASDATALLLLKQSFANSTSLSSWVESTTIAPCDTKSPWVGIMCYEGLVAALHLSGMSLGGTINVDALAQLPGLRVVRFSYNTFSGTIPALNRLTSLKGMYLSGNEFSGAIPDDFFTPMVNLRKLWLNGNSFSGAIPQSLANSSKLVELHIEDNKFSGTLPAMVMPTLNSFNISNNEFEGPIPTTLSNFNISSFIGNEGLCGSQINKPCSEAGTKGSNFGLVFFFILILLVGVLAGVMAYLKNQNKRFDTLGVDKGALVDSGSGRAPDSPVKDYESGLVEAKPETMQKPTEAKNKRTGSSSRTGEQAAAVRTGADLIMVNESKGIISLQDLMKAAAEVLGNGSMGSAYKALMSTGISVVVKRMRDFNRLGKEAFEVEMRRLGRLNHKNVLPPLAYHYRKEEKLIILEFIPKGSLQYILHGDRGHDHASLDWPTRAKIASGVTSGLVYLQTELSSLDVPHGNLKSSNIVLTHNFDALLSDYGFIQFVNPSTASNALQACKAPPEVLHERPSAKADVFCLGVVLLELLTGKFPSQYLSNSNGGTDVVKWAVTATADGREADILDPAIVASAKICVPDMTRLVKVAVECVEPDPERRLGLKEAAERIEEVCVAAAKAGPHLAYARDGIGERSARRSGSMGHRSMSGRRSDDGYSF